MVKNIMSLAATIGLIAVAGCGNIVDDPEPLAGLSGVTVESDGSASLVFFVCRGDVDEVSIYADREGLDDDEDNPLIASFSSASPLTGSITLALSDPGPTWSPDEPTDLDPSRGYLVSADDGDRNGTDTLYLAPGRLPSLEPGSVYAAADSGDALVPRTTEEFETAANAVCEEE